MHKYIVVHARYAMRIYLSSSSLARARSRGARSKKRSVGQLPLQRLETSLRRFRVATTRSPGFPLDFLRYPIDFPSKERQKERESANCPLFHGPSSHPFFSLSLFLQGSRKKKLSFYSIRGGERGRFVRVNPPLWRGLQWRDSNRTEEQKQSSALQKGEKKWEKEAKKKQKPIRQRSATGGAGGHGFPGKIPGCFSMTTRLSVLASWNDVTGGARAAFHSAVITLRAAQRRIKCSPRGKNPFSPRTGNMEKCYIVTCSERASARAAASRSHEEKKKVARVLGLCVRSRIRKKKKNEAVNRRYFAKL